MRMILVPRTCRWRLIGPCVCLLFLCSCTTRPTWPTWYGDTSVCPDLPAKVSFNKSAGRGEHLFVTLRLGSGEELLFGLDTGGPATLVDRSMEPKLGKRLARARFSIGDSGQRNGHVYRAPELYLGNTRLLTGKWVVTDDLSSNSFRPFSGILGMDCLRHYCIQLDFAANRLRFLDPDRAENEELGKAFPLTFPQESAFPFVSENLLGAKGANSLIDTGDYSDGGLVSTFFQRALEEQIPVSTNEFEASTDRPIRREARFKTCVFGGETYSDLTLREHVSGTNTIGLRFLARHLVTLNFPKQMMYLQRKSASPLAEGSQFTNSLAWWDKGTSALGWWETEGWSSGDEADESLARRLVSAPNIHPADALPNAVSWVNNYRSEFMPVRISVGPPEAKLSAVQLPAANYHVKFISKFKRKADGAGELSLGYLGDDNQPVVPAQELGTILILHDYASQKESLSPWAYVLAQAGYRVVLVDLRGHGQSSGQTISYGKFETADLKRVLDYVARHRGGARKVGVLGVGYGAHLALHWAAQDPRVRTVVAIAPYNQQEKTFERLAKEGKASIPPDVLKDALGLVAARLDIKWADWSSEAAVRQLKHPVLLIGGGNDTICTTNDLTMLQQAAPSGSKSILIPEANHGNIRYWVHEIAEPVKAWFHEQLAALPAESVQARKAMSP